MTCSCVRIWSYTVTAPCPSTLLVPSTTIAIAAATPTPDVITPPLPIDSATIIGASVGGALGGVLLISMATIIIVILIGCKVASKEKSKEQIPPPLQEEVFYDEIRENVDDRYKNNLPSEHIIVSSNQAYGKSVSATNVVPSPKLERKDEMEDNTAYGEVSTATKDKEEAVEDESGEYVPMAPLAMQASNNNEMYDSLRHV